MLSAAIGVSRVYLGVHFPSDVIAGAFLGILSGATALFLL
jgi:undecaprenyl-diphosphatase